MQSEAITYCGAEVILANTSSTTASGNSTFVPAAEYATKLPDGDWYRVNIPLSVWACQNGSTGNLTMADRVDFQNVYGRDADVCLDNIQIV
jgi:hypothetical protein